MRDLTAEEWEGWLWYMSREPFGFPALDLWHGMLCAVSIAPHLKPGTKPNPADYMIAQPPARELTPEQTVAHFRAALGGQTKKKA
jgi:hypothetical protein